MTLSIPASPYFDDVHTERLDGYGTFYHTYEFSIPSNHESAAMAVPKGTVIFPDLDGNTKCFVIKTVEEESSTDGLYKRVFAEDAAQDELMCRIIPPGSTQTEKDAEELLTFALTDTRWEVGITEHDPTVTRTHEFAEYESAWEAIMWISEQFSLEVQARVEVAGNQIVARYIDLRQTRGAFTGKVLQYKRDTSSIRRLGDGGLIFTAMYGLGSDSGGYPINFSSEVWTTAGGDPVDKPNGQSYVTIEAALNGHDGRAAYGIPMDSGERVHRFGVFRDSSEDNAAYLLQKTYDYLLAHSVPQYTYEADIISLERMPEQRPGDMLRDWERVRVGDTVIVKDTACYPPYQDEVRVSEVRRSYSDPTKDSITLGAPITRLSDYIKQLYRINRRLNV